MKITLVAGMYHISADDVRNLIISSLTPRPVDLTKDIAFQAGANQAREDIRKAFMKGLGVQDYEQYIRDILPSSTGR